MTPAELNASLPSSMRIGPYDVSLGVMSAREESENEGRVGFFSARRMEILVRPHASSTIDAADTLLHEINHAIWFVYGCRDEDNQERIVAAMANAWMQIYRDNPWLIQWIKQAVATGAK